MSGRSAHRSRMDRDDGRAPGSRRVTPMLRIREENVRMALEAAGMVTWEWDTRSGTIRYSDNVPAVAGGGSIQRYCAVEELLQTVHPSDRARVARAVKRTQSEGRPYRCEYRVRMLDGKYHWILGKGRYVTGRPGRPAMVIGISQDTTERKRAEKALARRSRQLAQLASELVLAESRERRRLADIVHDELQQLLVGARIQLHALSLGEKTSRRRHYDRLQHTLGEVLQLSRSITTDLGPPVLPQKELGAALEWLARSMMQRHHLAVMARVGRVSPDLDEARAVLLFTAARELLLNVVKHAAVGRAALSLRCRRGHVELEVSDRGKGFDRRSLDMAKGESGFGLFSIRERAALLGGSLAIESSPAHGTRAILSLRLPKARVRMPSSGGRTRRGGDDSA